MHPLPRNLPNSKVQYFVFIYPSNRALIMYYSKKAALTVMHAPDLRQQGASQ